MNGARAAEKVVLLDATGAAIGEMDKARVHGADTPLHLAFSCYGFGADGRMLLTRRSLEKQTWPGVWTNTCCGHPAPGESFEEAIRRRMVSELGVEPAAVRPVLPNFRYRAVAPDGMVENEVCPVYFAELSANPSPAASEVMDWEWVRMSDFLYAAAATPFLFSPWSVLQARELRERGVLS
ncbi:isopentenyl-diphosphate Delta-isomerase [Leifsonia kafniensis]|uniref:Isopentenyl-diphosphate Delta-isomerase n=1 Tax=Leifsonia kafniensis TaxID=475957 RepID=A0ABP7KRE8_9MICO